MSDKEGGSTRCRLELKSTLDCNAREQLHLREVLINMSLLSYVCDSWYPPVDWGDAYYYYTYIMYGQHLIVGDHWLLSSFIILVVHIYICKLELVTHIFIACVTVSFLTLRHVVCTCSWRKIFDISVPPHLIYSVYTRSDVAFVSFCCNLFRSCQ